MLGKIQRRIVRAFIAKPGADLSTGDLVTWCYPRLQGNRRSRHYFAIRRAAESVADRVGVGRFGAIVWRLKQSQLLPSEQNKQHKKQESLIISAG